MEFTEREKEIMEHYRISEFGEGIIFFAKMDTTGVALGELISRYTKTQQTIIDYDADYDAYVLRVIPKAYGDMKEAPEMREPPLKSGGCPYRLEMGKKLSELL